MMGHETAYASDQIAHSRASVSGALTANEKRRTLHGAIENVGGVGERIDETRRTFENLADRAQQLAAKLGGPYPTDASRKGVADASVKRPPQSSVEAINSSVSDLFGKVGELDPYIHQLSRALDMIDRAIG